jgi:hypothetical protein
MQLHISGSTHPEFKDPQFHPHVDDAALSFSDRIDAFCQIIRVCYARFQCPIFSNYSPETQTCGRSGHEASVARGVAGFTSSLRPRKNIVPVLLLPKALEAYKTCRSIPTRYWPSPSTPDNRRWIPGSELLGFLQLSSPRFPKTRILLPPSNNSWLTRGIRTYKADTVLIWVLSLEVACSLGMLQPRGP